MKKRYFATALSLMLTLAGATSTFGAGEFNPNVDITNINGNGNEFVDKYGLTTVVTVNGNKLKKFDVVNVGDQVTFDIILRPGNKALMENFVDTLPEGLKFETNSEYSYRVYAVNNDGTIGNDITDEGKSVINGRTFTWTPKNPEKYFFGGKNGVKNRLLFRIQTLVEHGVKPDTILTNVGETTFKPKGKEEPKKLSDKASVKVPATPRQPKVTKSVYAEDSKGYIPARLPSGSKVDEGYTGTSLTTEQANDLFKSELSKFIVEADKYKIDTTTLSKMLYDMKDDADAEYKAKVIEEFKKVLPQYSEKVAKETNSDTSKVADAVNEIFAKQNEVADNITLKSLADTYSYVINVAIPSKAVTTSFEVDDNIEHVQSLKQEGVKVYDDTGADITLLGAVTVEETGYDKYYVKWTAGDEYVKRLAETNTDKSVQVRITGVSVNNARSDDLEKYRLGGIITIPNTSGITYDGIKKESNKTLVRTPEPREYKDHKITKGVKTQDGKIVFANFSCQNVLYKFMYLYDKVEDFKNNLNIFIEKSSLSDAEKTELKSKVNALSVSSSKSDRENVLTAIASKDKSVEFDNGSTDVTLKNYTDYYTYLVNVELHPEKIKDTFSIVDAFADIQQFEVGDVRLYDETGLDVTSEFKLTVKDNVLTAVANAGMVKKVKSAKANSKYQLAVYNMHLSTDDTIRSKYVVGKDSTGTGTKFDIPNTSKLVVDNSVEINSNGTVVHAEIPNKIIPPSNKPKIPDNINPKDPGKTTPSNNPKIDPKKPDEISPLSPRDNTADAHYYDKDGKQYTYRDGVRQYTGVVKTKKQIDNEYKEPNPNVTNPKPNLSTSITTLKTGLQNRDLKNIKTGLGGIVSNRIMLLIYIPLGILCCFAGYKFIRKKLEDGGDYED